MTTITTRAACPGPTPPGRAARVIVVALMPFIAASAAGADTLRGNKERGRALYDKQCLVCHALEPEFHKEGPSLAGIFGRRAGTVPFFGKYKALKGSDLVWTEPTLDQWLANPRALVAGKDTGMTLQIPEAQDRADLIAFLKTVK